MEKYKISENKISNCILATICYNGLFGIIEMQL
jgi:hypothetical protein